VWVEQALRQALEAKAKPAQPDGVELGELEVMVRRVVAEELQPLREALAGLEPPAPVPNPASGTPISLMRHRRRQQRGC
jgi:hypothetical protein